jgi:preprotein translocase subunit SecF
MLTIFKDPHYDFVGKRHWAYAISVGLMLIALASLVAKGGLAYDIDFTGGTLVELRMPEATSVGTIRARLTEKGLGHSLIQEFGASRDFLIRTQVASANPAELGERVREALAKDGAGAPEIRRVEFVGPQIGQDLRRQAMYAILAALAGILLYIWMRFDLRGGVATILSVGHDVLICLGGLSLTNREFSLPVLAALLTVIGYAVNDRIVMYDRLREIRSRAAARGVTFAEQVNMAVNQTLSRTVLTVATVILSAAMLFLFGGASLENFAFVVLIGAFTAPLSTVYVAAALDVDGRAWLSKRRGAAPVRAGRKVARS